MKKITKREQISKLFDKDSKVKSFDPEDEGYDFDTDRDIQSGYEHMDGYSQMEKRWADKYRVKEKDANAAFYTEEKAEENIDNLFSFLNDDIETDENPKINEEDYETYLLEKDKHKVKPIKIKDQAVLSQLDSLNDYLTSHYQNSSKTGPAPLLSKESQGCEYKETTTHLLKSIRELLIYRVSLQPFILLLKKAHTTHIYPKDAIQGALLGHLDRLFRCVSPQYGVPRGKASTVKTTRKKCTKRRFKWHKDKIWAQIREIGDSVVQNANATVALVSTVSNIRTNWDQIPAISGQLYSKYLKLVDAPNSCLLGGLIEDFQLFNKFNKDFQYLYTKTNYNLELNSRTEALVPATDNSEKIKNKTSLKAQIPRPKCIGFMIPSPYTVEKNNLELILNSLFY